MMVNLMKTNWCVSILFLSVVSFSVYSQDDQNDKKTVEVYESPRNKDLAQPIYPTGDAIEGNEGWVVINFMVDVEGNAFEPSVVASTGSNGFEREAIKALSKSKFEPAKLEGKPVIGSRYMRYTFSLANEEIGADPRFISNYKRLSKAFEKNNKEDIDKELNKLQDRKRLNHYERAYLDFALSVYASQFGSKVEQMQHLRNALRYESYYDDNKEFLPEDLIRSARIELYTTEVQSKRFAEAVQSFHVIRRKFGEETVEPLRQSYEQIIALKSDDTAYAVDSALDENGYFHIELHKQGVAIQDATDTINEFKLRCAKKYIFFAYEKDKQYRIPKSWGPCSLQVLGQANTNFKLVQFK